ncbi:MAG: glycosyl hydrolase family 28 protein [Bacteroidota bacterium]
MRLLFFVMVLFFSTLRAFSQDYDIVSFGAKPDGKTLNTKAIQKAIDAAHSSGGGRVVVPVGKFVTGSIRLKSRVELHVEQDGVLLGSTDPAHYFKINRWKGLVMADGADHIAITGKGEINGRGRQVALAIDSLFYAGEIDSTQYNFVEMRPKYYLRPQLIELVSCKNIKIKNITLKNAACWVQTYDRCVNIVMNNVTTISDAYWNNDGIDIQDCKNVRITNCFVDSADDGICLKSQRADYLCDSIFISNCTVRSSASAVKFGTVSHGGFKNIVIKNIKVYDTFRSAIAIEVVDGGTLENILVDSLTAVNTGNAIFIRLGERSKKKSMGILRDVTLRNIKVEVAFERPDYAYEIRGPALPYFHNIFPSSITGIPGFPVKDITLENIEIIYPGKGNKGLAYAPLSRLDQVPENVNHYPEFSMFGELPAWGFYIRHVDGLTMKNIKLQIQDPDYRPALIFDKTQHLELEHVAITGDDKDQQIILHNTKDVKLDKQENVRRR